MPYINQSRRVEVECIPDDDARTPGELNFQISDLVNDYVITQGLSYQTINDVIGALEGAKLEFYRRIAAPYEDRKIEENGDVYDDA